MARAILAELESIKTQLEIIAEEMPGHRSQLYEINARITRVEESTKSAHHRIDDFKRDVCFTIGVSTTVVGIFASILTWLLGGRRGNEQT